MENQYGTMTLAELRNLAKEKGIQGISTKKKQDLIDLLSELKDAPQKEEKPQNKKEKKDSVGKSAAETKRGPEDAKENQAEGKGTTRKQGEEKERKQDKENPAQKEAEQQKEAEKKDGLGRKRGLEKESAPRPEALEGKESAPRPEAPEQRESAERLEAQERKENLEHRGSAERKEGPERREFYDRPRYDRRENQERRDMRENHARPGYYKPVQERYYQGNNSLAGQSAASANQDNSSNNPNQHGTSGYTAGSYRPQQMSQNDIEQLDSGETKEGILEIMPEGFGFIRCDNFLPGDNDVYVAPVQIRRMNLKTGDIIVGNTKIRNQNEKFSALLYVKQVNGMAPAEALKRPKFEDLTPIFPNSRIHLETPGCKPAMRMVDLISPIGKGQRGMIVSQPKAGKTTLLKQIASAVYKNHPDMHMIILLIDERPEEVTDMKESIQGDNVEVIYSTFDELPENHKRVSEMVIERAKRLVEHGRDVIILLDSITRLARAYNLTVQASGRTLSGGLDPAALHMPKKFFGAARNMREGGSLTILATALVETGSRMDDVVFEEFKGTGNMELVLDRNLSERRVFPAIDLPRSSTRRDDLLLRPAELEANMLMRRAFNGMKSEDAVERIIQMFAQTRSNAEFIEMIKKTKFAY